MPAKWASQWANQPRGPLGEQQQQQQQQQQQHQNQHQHQHQHQQPLPRSATNRTRSLFEAGAHEGPLVGALSPSKSLRGAAKIDGPAASGKQAPGSFRGGIAGYLASKLSNLASLGGGGAGGSGSGSHQPGGHSSSASVPSSPAAFNKRVQGQLGGPFMPSRLSRAFAASERSGHNQLVGPHLSAQASGPPALSQFELTLAAIAATSRDYNGCDFILILESSSSGGSGVNLNSASGAPEANQQASGCGGGGGGQLAASLSSALIIHLVAPNLQEKAAWMSDISQVSGVRVSSHWFRLFPFRPIERPPIHRPGPSVGFDGLAPGLGAQPLDSTPFGLNKQCRAI